MSARKVASSKLPALSRRERQIMDVLYRLGQATAADVQEGLPHEPSYSTVRAQLRVLEEKGHVRHEGQDLRYVYSPTLLRDVAGRSALRHLAETFFNGSAELVVTALLGGDFSRLTPEELDRVGALVNEAKRKSAERP